MLLEQKIRQSYIFVPKMFVKAVNRITKQDQLKGAGLVFVADASVNKRVKSKQLSIHEFDAFRD